MTNNASKKSKSLIKIMFMLHNNKHINFEICQNMLIKFNFE